MVYDKTLLIAISAVFVCVSAAAETSEKFSPKAPLLPAFLRKPRQLQQVRQQQQQQAPLPQPVQPPQAAAAKVEELILKLADENPVVSNQARCDLIKLGNSENSNSVVKLLAEALKSKDWRAMHRNGAWRLRRSLVKVLGKLEAQAVLAPLAKALNDEERIVRTDAIEILGKMAIRTRNPRLTALLRETLIGNEDRFVRFHAALTLSEMKEPSSTNALINALGDECPLVRLSAAWGLGRIKDSKAVDPLIKALKDDETVHVRACSVWALNEIMKTWGRLEKALNAAKIYEVYNILDLEKNKEIKKAAKELEKGAKNPAVPVRRDPLTEVSKAVKEDEAERAIRCANWILSKVKENPGEIEKLKALFNNKDKESGARYIAAALAKVRTEEAIELLKKLLGGNDPLVQRILPEGEAHAKKIISEIKKEFGIEIEEIDGRPFYNGELKTIQDFLRAMPWKLIKELKEISASTKPSACGHTPAVFSSGLANTLAHQLARNLYFKLDEKNDASVLGSFVDAEEFAAAFEDWFMDTEAAIGRAVEEARPAGANGRSPLHRTLVIAKLFMHKREKGKLETGHHVWGYKVDKGGAISWFDLVITTDNENKVVKIGNAVIDTKWDIIWK